jgi:8-oxo-dGTP pyrophosphatase MutT (NUDIX family)
MSIFSHNVYDNIRTRVIVLHQQQILLLPPTAAEAGWQAPGGGLEPNESLTDCAVREVLEETGLHIRIVGIAFLREWVVPKYCTLPDQPDGTGFGLEVFLYAFPSRKETAVRPEQESAGMPRWVPLAEVANLPLWPKELKTLASHLLAGVDLYGVPSFVSQLESPLAAAPEITFGLQLHDTM